MKNLTIVFLLFLFFSCNEKKDQLSLSEQTYISEQSELLKQDPVAVEYFEAMDALFTIIREEDIDMMAFLKISQTHKKDLCNKTNELFKNNPEMEKYAEAKCRIDITGKAFRQKYPFVKDLSKAEKKELYKTLIIKPVIDFEKVKERGEKLMKSMSPEEIEELKNIYKNNPDAAKDFLQKKFKVDKDVLKKMMEEYSKVK